MSIFQEYYTNQPFVDRYALDSANAVDVIIPVFHTNELWHINLISIYREVPVRRLLISDGGVIDDSIDIVRKFPRVEVFNHRHFKSLGKCIAELIKEVSSEWFISLHSDVYLPAGWFDAMLPHSKQYDWYGCPMNITVLTQYRPETERPYAGSQMGRKAAFMQGIDCIDDDYVYRQEDFVFNKIVEDAGYKTGKIENTFHYHQLMYRNSTGYDLNIKSVSVETKTAEAEILRTQDTQLRGIVKYLDPKEDIVVGMFQLFSSSMLANNQIEYTSFRQWIKLHNPKWLPYFDWRSLIKVYLFKILRKTKRVLKNILGFKS
jgi:hypothetical protein